MSGRFLPASRSLRGFRSGSSISICLFRCSRASSSTARCSMAARDSGVKGRRQWGPRGTRVGRDELAILASWVQGPEGWKVAGQLQPVVLEFWGSPILQVYCVRLTSYLPAGWAREVGAQVLLELGDLPARPVLAAAQVLGRKHPPPQAPQCTPLSKKLRHLRDQQKPNQILFSLGSLGPMPQCPDSSDAASWVQTPRTVWLQPIGTQRENLY